MNQVAPHKGDGNALRLVVGFPDPPEIVPFSVATGQRLRDITAKLDALAIADPKAFGGEIVGALQQSLKDVAKANAAIDPMPKIEGLNGIESALAGFSITESDTRAVRTVWERLRGRPSPLTLFLDRVEALTSKLPRLADAQADGWKELAAAYQAACDRATELTNAISAGQEQIAGITAEFGPAHEHSLAKSPEERGHETERALSVLRAARDDIERQIHSLRLTRKRGVELLAQVQTLAAYHQDFERIVRVLDQRALPAWESALSDLIHVASSGEALPDPSDVHRLTSELKDEFGRLQTAGATLLEAHEATKRSFADAVAENVS